MWIFAPFAEDGSARFISRNLLPCWACRKVARLLCVLFTARGGLVMERKMMLGGKARAERRARDRTTAS